MHYVHKLFGQSQRFLCCGLTVSAFLFFGTVFFIDAAAGPPRHRVSVSAKPLGVGSGFEAFVDARGLPEPYALKQVNLLIRCVAPSGKDFLVPILFHENSLGRGQLYKKVLKWPTNCARWVRLEDASVNLSAGKADAGIVDVSAKQGSILGPINDLSQPPDAPRLISPPNGSVFNHFPRHLTLNWSPVLGASSYVVNLEIWFQGKWYHHKYFDNIKSTSHSFDFGCAGPGRWRVCAVLSERKWGFVSDWSEFRFTR